MAELGLDLELGAQTSSKLPTSTTGCITTRVNQGTVVWGYYWGIYDMHGGGINQGTVVWGYYYDLGWGSG